MPGPSRVAAIRHRGGLLALLAAVVLFHAVAVALWRSSVVQRQPMPMPQRAPMLLRLLPASPEVPQPWMPRTSVSRMPTAAPSNADVPRNRVAVSPGRSNPPSTAAAPSPEAPSPEARSASVQPVQPAETAASAPPLLDLDLRRASRGADALPGMTERARDDARLDPVVRPRLETAMAATLSDLRSADTLADGTQRIREGRRCTLVHPTRASGLDASDRVHNLVGGSEPCP